MMPLTTYTIPGTSSTVMIRTCDGCGAPNAPYGTGSATKDPSKVKVWCGPDGCRKAQQPAA